MTKPRSTNFDYLDPNAPRTQRIIEAALTVTVPWHPPEDRPAYQPSHVAALAMRIDHRARQGLTVHLKPATARTVASTLRLYAEGHRDLRSTHPHHVEDWTHEPHEILAYCANASLAIGAWEAHAPRYPNRNLIATWGGWITRGSKRNRG
ncbi:MAG: hypothetical protein K2Y71_00810 [Xanthobacteraceae bacterium]|nr:hypothetical protein [Xanthobacteraceae bacterium]